MITAVDSSVLLDVLTNDRLRQAGSLNALRDAKRDGALIVCPVVWAEVRGFFDDSARMLAAFSGAEIDFDPFDRECADLAGKHWNAYRRAGGKRVRPVADFLVGAHALVRGARLLTHDRGFYRRCFEGLHISSPPLIE